MPAQGRGAFLPPPVTPTPAPSLGHVLAHAIHAARHIVAPAVHTATQTAARAPAIVHAAGRVGSAVQHGVAAPLHRVPNEVSPALLRATVEQNPLLRYHFQSQLENALLQERADRRQLLQQAHERAGKGGALNLGFVNLTPLATVLATGASKLGIGQALGGTPGKVLNEALDLPGQAFLSGALALKASEQAGQKLGSNLFGGRGGGSFAPAEQLGGAVLSQVEHPVRSFKEAPLSTALMFAGGESALGGLGGRLARTGALGERAAELAGTERPSLQLYNGLAKDQTYNSDPLRKLAQTSYERALTRLPGGLRQEDPFVAQDWRLRRNLVGGVVKPGRVDYGAAATEAGRRTLVKNSVVPKAQGLKPSLEEAAHPFFDRTLRNPETAHADAQKRLDVLEAARPGLRKAQLKANGEAIDEMKAVLAASPEELQQANAAAETAIRQQRPLTAYEITDGSLRAEQARAVLHPYAISHMGAKHFTAEDHAHLERQAAAAESEVQQRLAQLEPGSAEHAHALRELAAARGHRWEVSGRGSPEDQAAHEQSVEAHQAAVLDAQEAQQRLSGIEHARSRLVGAYGRSRPQQDARAAEGGGRAMDAADARVRGAKEALAAAKSREAELREAVEPQPRQQAGMRTAEGKHLPDEAIEAHMVAHGVPADENGRPLVGYSSHQAGIAGSSSYFRSALRQPSLHRNLRTGDAYSKGLNDHSFAGLVGQLAHQASRVAQHEGFNALSKDYMIGHYTPEEARIAAENFNSPESALTGADRAQELGGMLPIDKGTMQILEKNTAPVPRDVSGELAARGLAEHTPAEAAEVGKYGLIPKAVHDRLQQHQDAASAKTGFKKWAQLYTQGFRHVKFATSPKHAAGIVEESVIRPLTEGAGVQSWRLGRQALKQVAHLAQTDPHGTLFDLGPEGARFRRLQGELSGRGLVGSQKMQDIVRRTGGWDETSTLGAKAELAAHSPPMRAWIKWRNFTERGLEGIAHNSRTAVFGKMLKDTGFVDSAQSFLRLQDEAQRAMIAGKMTPDKANLIARKLDDAAGNWNNLTPKVKAAVSTVTPFGLWWLNSMRWLYRLPVTHPIKTAVAASIYQATREQRNAIGQGYQAPGVGTKDDPNYLQGTIPVNLPLIGHVLLDLGHYSPLGVAGPDAPSTAAEQLGPQFEGVLSALTGTNALTHEKATQAGGAELTGPQKISNALAEVVSGPAIGATQAQQLLQGGGKPYGTANLFTDLAAALGGPAQTKPGTKTGSVGSLLKLLDPLKVYKDKTAGSTVPQTPAAQRAISRSSATSAFNEARVKRAVERSERAAGR